MAKKIDVIDEAKSLFQKDKDAWSEIYRKAKDDIAFMSDDDGAQWDLKAYTQRLKDGRPALTMDKLGQFTRQVANKILMNTPTINIIPSDKGADEETADIIKGLIRGIEYHSRADDAYDMAVSNAVRCGIGFIRVDHDYDDGFGFDQVLQIKRVVNPFSVYLDADSIEIDGRDAMHGFILDDISVGEFKKKYKGFEPVSFTESPNSGGCDDDVITIAEFFKIVESDKEIALYDEKEGVVDFDENRKEEAKLKRTIKHRRVKRMLLSGNDILEQTEFVGSYIPLIPVYGEEHWQDGKRHLHSLIRKAKTAQQVYNTWKSIEMQLLQQAPQAPFQAAEGQTEDYADDYNNPESVSVLRYSPVDVNGVQLPPPQRTAPAPVPVGVLNASLGAVDDIKSAMGLFNASIGQQGNETSGIAIARRNQQGEVGTYHFVDNLSKSITQVGRVLVSAIPEIYDTERLVLTIGAEETAKLVQVNGGKLPKGQERIYDLTNGRYSVRVTTGTSFTTARQEASDFYSQVVANQPQLMGIAGDLVFKNMDVVGAEALSERIKKTIPPELLEDDGAEVDPEKLQLQQAIEQSQGLIASMQQEMQAIQAELNNKQADIALKAQSENNKAESDKLKLEIELLKLQQDAKEDEFNASVKERELLIKQEELALKREELEIEKAEAELKKIEALAKIEMERERVQLQEMQQAQSVPIGMSGDSLAALDNEVSVFNGENE